MTSVGQTPGWKRRNRRAYRVKLKRDVLNAYGGKCECCGITEPVFLSIDHIDGGGNDHRKEVGSGTQFYQWLRCNNYPDGYRILCKNCNFAVSQGTCPHQLEVADAL